MNSTIHRPARMSIASDARLRGAALHVGLFLSGASALVYESAWARMLHRVFGVSDLAVATVLASFFLGMGIGALVGGRWSSAMRHPARTYAMLETGVAVLALLSLIALPEVHRIYAALGSGRSFAALSALRLVIALSALVPPTALMGATLPVLVAAIANDPATWRARANALYATNTAGAVLGAGLTGFVLLPSIGIRASVVVAALGSLIAAAIVALVVRGSGIEVAETPGRAAEERVGHPSLAILPSMGIAFVLGALALAGEVLWTRALRLVIQGSSQAFASMLVIYLLGIALGSVLASRFGEGRTALRALGRAHVALVGLVALSMSLLPMVPRLLVLIHGEAELVPSSASVMLAMSALLLLPLATALGTGLPLLLRSVAAPRGSESRASGLVLGANTLGGLVGSLVAGFALVPAIGLERALWMLVLAHALVGIAALMLAADEPRRRLEALALPALVLGVVVRLHPSIELPFLLDAWYEPSRAAIEGPTARYRENVVFLREGRNTTVSVLRRGDTLRLFNDGRPESGIAVGDPAFGPELVMLGGLPSLLAEKTDRALMVGLGAGHSTTMLLAGPFRRVDVVELEPAVVEAARAMHAARNRPFPLDDPRARLVIDDARAQLTLAPPGTYDAIVSQPSHPWLSGASALYTREFFLEAKRCLAPGGVFAQWVNLFRMDVPRLRQVVATLRSVFPYVGAYVVEDSSFILVAGDRPVSLESRAALRFVDHPALRRYFAAYDLATVAEVAATSELDSEAVDAFVQGVEWLTDDRPTLEYALTRLPHASTLSERDLDRAFERLPWMSRRTQAALPESIRGSVPLFRLARLEPRRGAVRRVSASLGDLSLSRDERALVEGAIAETLGDVRGALERYDESRIGEAASRADALRQVDGLAEEALGVAMRRSTVPTDATALARAALDVGGGEASRFATRIADRAAQGAEEPIRSFVALEATGGCDAILAREWDSAELTPEALSRLAACAARAGRSAEATAFADARAYVRRAMAYAWHERAERAVAGGNTALAIRFERRALRAWPPLREAVEGLADDLCAVDRCDQAGPVLEAGIVALRFSAGADRPLRAQAERLGVRLPPATP